ncbi:hypothetical protein GUITHDRAFT_114027 [Guillardia theta CCMP2712]|uniref:Uncharacterized protein n=1 Tax=Guillardia theta (strain CCMP2712) TaxID=905079 RepID=L1IV95_GUITC|nr:hypothetical protein GUITHDRAFT_114027 [Guillardia theta CCMP2712]EKX39779.1 hypothetical protein GUITHDRAFT_114027 [Guillardia theta CCMP2712]|eukprot:XP_005826759.1 hypothetical protein GUITHDRAFT_114027 [Guillardia theta CCMP2712]
MCESLSLTSSFPDLQVVETAWRVSAYLPDEPPESVCKLLEEGLKEWEEQASASATAGSADKKKKKKKKKKKTEDETGQDDEEDN